MFDIEVKNLYEKLQKKLKSASEIALNNISQEINSSRNYLISRINDMVDSYGIKIDNNLIEDLVDENLIQDLKSLSLSTLSKNYRKLCQFNDSIQAVILQQSKAHKSREEKKEPVKLVMDKFDYVMSVYKETEIDLLEQYDCLFQIILRKIPLYETRELVEDIKSFLSQEKDSMEKYIQNQRNHIITSNLNDLVDSNTYLTEETDFTSTSVEVSQVVEEVQSQEKEIEDEVEKQVLESYEHSKKLEEEASAQRQNIPSQYQETPLSKKDNDLIIENIQHEEEYKTLHVPNVSSSETYLKKDNMSVPEKNYRILDDGTIENNYIILDDGTIECLKPKNVQSVSEEYYQVTEAPSKVDNEVMLIDAVKKSVNDNLENEIGIISSNTDNVINVISSQTLSDTQAILEKYGINSTSYMTQRIVQQLDDELKKINDNLSENMIRSFTKINDYTISAVSQTFAKPEEIRNQDVEQCMEVYKNSTSLAGFKLTCHKQFDQCINKICYQYNISKYSSAYNELFRIFENKRIQMESQFYNMYMTFSNNNSMFIERAIDSMMLSQEMMKEMQQDLSPQQIQTMVGLNYQEYEKNKAQRDLGQISNMSR